MVVLFNYVYLILIINFINKNRKLIQKIVESETDGQTEEKDILSATEKKMLIESIKGMKERGLTTCNEKNPRNQYRTALKNFLRVCWDRLPNAMHCPLPGDYHCQDMSYNQVINFLSANIFKFLFHGKSFLMISIPNEDGILVPTKFKFLTQEGTCI